MSVTTLQGFSSREPLYNSVDSLKVPTNQSIYLERFLRLVSYVLILATFPFSVYFCLAIVKEYEKVVIFRLGRIMAGCPKGPGLFFVVPCMDSLVKVDLRTFNFTIPLSEVLLKDSIPINVEAIVYAKVTFIMIDDQLTQ